jgi:hypothetical protein
MIDRTSSAPPVNWSTLSTRSRSTLRESYEVILSSGGNLFYPYNNFTLANSVKSYLTNFVAQLIYTIFISFSIV